MEMLAVLLALFVYQVFFVQSEITVPFTSWSCNTPKNNPETLSIGFLKTENTDSLISNETKLNRNMNNNNYKNNAKIPTQEQPKEKLIKPPEAVQSKHLEGKTGLCSPIKPVIGLFSIPNSVTSQNNLLIQNPKEKMTPQVSSLPMTELSKFDINNALSTKYTDVNYRDPTAVVAQLNNLRPSYTENLSTNNDLIPSKLYTVSEPSNKSTINSDLSRSKDYLCDCNAKVKPYVPITASDVKTIEPPKFQTLFPQWLLTDEKRNKIPGDTSPQLTLNIMENPFKTTPDILVDTLLPDIQNLYVHKDSNNAELNNAPATVRFTVNGDLNCALVYSYDSYPERMTYVPIPAVITSDVVNIEIPNYKTPQFSLQDGYIGKQQSGTSTGIATNTKENLAPAPPYISDNVIRTNLENLFANKDIDSGKLNCAPSVTLSTPILTINDDLNCAKTYLLPNNPAIKTVITPQEKKSEMPIPQPYASQISLSDVNREKTPIGTSAESATNIKENLISALPNILADATIKALKIASPLLNDKGIYVANNLLNNNMQNMNTKIANPSPITEKIKESSTAEFSKPLKNMSKVPNIQMNVMPIINNNIAPVTQLNLRSNEVQNEKNNGNGVQYLRTPQISNIPITLSVPSKVTEIYNFGLHQSNEPHINFNTINIPQTTSTYIGPVNVPPDPSVYKTWSDKYTNCLRNSLNQFVSVLTSNILSAFKENRTPYNTMNTFTKPVTKSNDISSIITKTPNSLNLPVFSLSPPLVQSPKSLPRPTLNLPVVDTTSEKISSHSEKINRSTGSSHPYISSITINLSPSKDTTNNIIIMI